MTGKNKDNSIQKINNLNRIFDELVFDAKELTRDLTLSLKMHLFVGIYQILFAIQFGWYTFYQLKDYSLIPILFFTIMLVAGILFLVHYFNLRKKYSKLYDIQKELKIL